MNELLSYYFWFYFAFYVLTFEVFILLLLLLFSNFHIHSKTTKNIQFPIIVIASAAIPWSFYRDDDIRNSDGHSSLPK